MKGKLCISCGEAEQLSCRRRCRTCYNVDRQEMWAVQSLDPAVRDAFRLRKAAYRKTEKGRALRQASQLRWSKRALLEIRVQKQAQKAIRLGILVRQPCEVCQSTQYIHAHHEDYSRPLDVRWLCSFHHSRRHMELDAEK